MKRERRVVQGLSRRRVELEQKAEGRKPYCGFKHRELLMLGGGVQAEVTVLSGLWRCGK